MMSLPQNPPANPGASFVEWTFTGPDDRELVINAAYDMREDEARRSRSIPADWVGVRRVIR